jgi:hypothetical protein
MQRYWLKILAGALGIFLVGMLGVTLTRHGVSEVKGIVESASPISIPIAFVPFRLDGEHLGTVRRLTVLRDAPDRVRSIQLSVQLDDSAATARLANCLLTANEARSLGEGTTFFCATPADSARDSLVTFGEVTFQPAGLTREFLVPAREAAGWRDSLSHHEDPQTADSAGAPAGSAETGADSAALHSR